MSRPGALIRHRLRNALQSVALLAAMALLLAAIGWILGGADGTLWTLLLGLALLLFAPRLPANWLLPLYRARPLSAQEAPVLYAIVVELARRAGLAATPTLHYVPSPVPNAFSVGSDQRAAIAVSDGLLRRLELRELVGVLAHETSHLAHHDTRVMALADLMSRLTALLALLGQLMVLIYLPLLLLYGAPVPWLGLLLLLLAPTLSTVLQLALSRTREFDADLGAAALTGDPAGLAAALAKLDRPTASWLQRLLLPGRLDPDPSLLRSHPHSEARIRRLLSLTAAGNARSWHGPRGDWLPAHLTPVQRRPRRHLNGLWH